MGRLGLCAGRDVPAPEEEIAGEQFKAKEKRQIQEFLQDSHIEAFGYLADRLGPMEGCLGFDVSVQPS